MNIFQLAPNDQSLFYLKYIFGSVGNLLDATGSNPTINIIGVLFKYLNTLGLTIGAVLIVYIVIVGLLKTASEGEFLGRHWNSLWVPIRMVIGIASLFPTTTGYSALQVAMMWLVVQGVGAGDALWTTALNYNAVMGSPYATFSIPAIQVNQNMQQLYKGLVCQETAYQKSPRTLSTGQTLYYCGQSSQDPVLRDFCNTPINLTLNPNGGAKALGPAQRGSTDGACGQLTLCDKAAACKDSTSLNCQICTTQISQMQNIVTVLGGIAQAYVKADAQYVDFYRNDRPANPATESWIVSYCAANGIAAADCCSVADFNNNKFLINPNLPCANSQRASALFKNYSPYQPPGSFLYRSAGDNTVKELYKDYVLKNAIQVSGTSTGAEAGKNQYFIDIAVSQYTRAISQKIAEYFSTAKPALTGWQADAKDKGWMLAGAYYYEMASADSVAQASVPNWAAVSKTPANEQQNPLYYHRDNIQASTVLLDAINQDMANQSGKNTGTFAALNSNPTLSQVSAITGSAATGIMNLFRDMMTGNGGSASTTETNFVSSPLVKLHAFGEGLLILADVLVTVFTIYFIVLLLSNWNVFVMGSGVISPLSTFGIGMLMIIVPMCYALIGALYAFGGLIAVYTPLVPYIIYSMGVIGWLIAVIEAMVAMPFVALGIMSPSGEHELLGRAHHGLSHISNLFLRPCLMVFGMIASMLLLGAGVTLINASFSGVMATIGGAATSQGQMGLVELIMFIAAYTSLLLTVVNKCCTLIFVIPESALTMIGLQPVKYGEEAALSGVKGAVESAGARAGGAMAGMMQSTGNKGIAAQKQGHADKKADADAAKQAALIGKAVRGDGDKKE